MTRGSKHRARSAALIATSVLLAICSTSGVALARGGRGGGGGHSSGGSHSSGGFHSSSGTHFSSGSSGGSGHYSSGGSSGGSHYSTPHYSSPSYSTPHSSGGTVYGRGGTTYHTVPSGAYGRSGATTYRTPSAGTVYGRSNGPIGTARVTTANIAGRPVVGGGHGYIGGGRGYYAAGARVPVFAGGHRGRGIWWGPQYGWRVPVYWGGYYTPYAGYWGVGYWVTDWVMLDLLAAEEARMLAYESSYGYVPAPRESAALPQDVREELRLQIEQYIAEPTPDVPASSAPGNTLVVNDPRVARALSDSHHVFVVSQPITVTDRGTGEACTLTHADLLRTYAPVPSGQSWADATVAASKTTSCRAGAVVAVPVANLVRFEQDLLDRVNKGAAAARATENDPAPPPSAVVPPAPTQPMPQRLNEFPEEEPMPSASDLPSDQSL